jgi:hypothetical protein
VNLGKMTRLSSQFHPIDMRALFTHAAEQRIIQEEPATRWLARTSQIWSVTMAGTAVGSAIGINT